MALPVVSGWLLGYARLVTTRIPVILTAMIVSVSHAQTIRTLRIEPVPADIAPDTERFSVRVGQVGQDQALPWPTQRIAWMFWRTGDRQENRHHPEPTGEQSVSIDLAPIGASTVGVELDPVIETVSPEDWQSFRERVSFVGGAGVGEGVDEEVTRIRRRESLVAIIRASDDATGASPIATSKLGMHAEIRPLMDPTRIQLGSDMAFRIYIDGVSVTGQRVIATHIDSGESHIITTRSGGFGDLRINQAGNWRLEFHRASLLVGQDSDKGPDADLNLTTGVLTFTVPGGEK